MHEIIIAQDHPEESAPLRIPIVEGKTLLSHLVEAGIHLENPCNGKGTCGKCKVNIISHSAVDSKQIDSESAKAGLSKAEIAGGYRLSCMIRPSSTMTIKCKTDKREHRILTTGIAVDMRNMESHQPVFSKLLALGDKEQQVTKTLHMDTVIGIEEGDTTKNLFGVAVDIGTTTVVMALVDLRTGQELTTASMINPQIKYGLDVISRIAHVIENPNTGTMDLQTEIIGALNGLLAEVCQKAGIKCDWVYGIVVAANSAMLHFLTGTDASSLGRFPYEPVFTEAIDIPLWDLGLKASPHGILHCMPSVSAYIGADIVAGAYACNLHEKKGNTLFIDIGTNGEIVLSKEGKLISCSCAAGPALEGMNISSGMRAAVGAVENLTIHKDTGTVELETIGDTAPVGLCGSGILAAVKELIRTGLVAPNGAFVKMESIPHDDPIRQILRLDGNKREAKFHDQITVTQKDVRQVQLAKGAILSGFQALLDETATSMDSLDEVVIAGQFGAHLPVESLTGVGILPGCVSDRIRYVGNSAKTGAFMSLLSQKARNEISELAGAIGYLELGTTKEYDRLLSQCMVFPTAKT